MLKILDGFLTLDVARRGMARLGQLGSWGGTWGILNFLLMQSPVPLGVMTLASITAFIISRCWLLLLAYHEIPVRETKTPPHRNRRYQQKLQRPTLRYGTPPVPSLGGATCTSSPLSSSVRSQDWARSTHLPPSSTSSTNEELLSYLASSASTMEPPTSTNSGTWMPKHASFDLVTVPAPRNLP